MGIASARPPAIIVLMPTTRPAVSARGPPELPGARRRSAWIQRLPPGSDGAKACTTPAVSVRRRPRGWPRATTRAPTRKASESARAAGATRTRGMRRSARSARRSTLTRCASTCRSSASPTRTHEARATWAFVTTRSGAHRMPAPPPPGLWISTVTCWSRSAIRARCGGRASSAGRALTDGYLELTRLAAAQDARRDGLPDAIGLEHGEEISRLGDRMPGDRDDDVADDQSHRGCGAVGRDVHDDDRRPLGQAESLTQMIGKHDRLRADAEVRPRNLSATYHVLCQSGDCSGADRTLKMPGYARRPDADDPAEHIDERPPREARVKGEIDCQDLAGHGLAAAANVQCADDAGAGPGARAESQDKMADAEVTIVANVGDGHAVDLGAEHGDVEAGIAPGDPGR